MKGRDVSSFRNWLTKQPILDWLDRYGAAKGFVPDTSDVGYVPEADYGEFVKKKAIAFEAAVLALLKQRLDVAEVVGARGNSDASYEQTLRLISEGREVIYPGLVRDPELAIFGVPDLLIRGDTLERLVPGTLESGDPSAYYVLDIKFSSLNLNKKGDLSAAKGAWPRYQVPLYERALASMLGRVPGRGYVLGRRLSGSAGANGGCLDKLGWVPALDADKLAEIEAGRQWLEDLETKGAEWQIVPPSDARLAWNFSSKDEGVWHSIRKAMTPKEDPAPVESDLPLTPQTLMARRDEWHPKPALEFFVDYETLNDQNDSYGRFPTVDGRPMIFMIGCGHEEEGRFEFKVWTALDESPAEEARIIQAWQDHMEATGQRLAPDLAKPWVYHWHKHEVQQLTAAAERHSRPKWNDVGWFDLLTAVLKAENAQVRGVNGLSLKPVTRALHGLGLIETVWGPSAVEGGLQAMTAAWSCYNVSRETGTPVHEIVSGDGELLMSAIESYNEVDCKAMWEILRYLRAHH